MPKNGPIYIYHKGYVSEKRIDCRIRIDLLKVLTVYCLFLLGRSCLLIFDYSAGQEEYFGQDY